ncbi:MAG: hypothetical protein CMN28_12275 [Salinisphaeraceae bacterium]|nr:hypothetical protein [Salinisphaeraceae bacterium]
MVTFQNLWMKHPTITGPDNPCSSNGRKNFSNQCAIRVGHALAECGIDTRRIRGARHCWQHDNAMGHILRAEELARGLDLANIAGLGKKIEVSPAQFSEALKGKTGIIFFKDYWIREGEVTRNASGDHIDLWNGSRLTDWTSWLRIQMRIGSWGLHSISDAWSDFQDAKAIWFWSAA